PPPPQPLLPSRNPCRIRHPLHSPRTRAHSLPPQSLHLNSPQSRLPPLPKPRLPIPPRSHQPPLSIKPPHPRLPPLPRPPGPSTSSPVKAAQPSIPIPSPAI